MREQFFKKAALAVLELQWANLVSIGGLGKVSRPNTRWGSIGQPAATRATCVAFQLRSSLLERSDPETHLVGPGTLSIQNEGGWPIHPDSVARSVRIGGQGGCKSKVQGLSARKVRCSARVAGGIAPPDAARSEPLLAGSGVAPRVPPAGLALHRR